MSKTIVRAIARLGDEPYEILWLPGLIEDADANWQVRVALQGTRSQQLHMKPLPIGLLPMLTLGSVFVAGELVPAQGGVVTSLAIDDLSRCEVVTSADIPPALYSFHGRASGVQRLFRYRTPCGKWLLIPVIELVRYLFLHNKTLADALMRPGAVNLLFAPQVPGYQAQRHLRFTLEMPVRCLSQRFAKEFAWLALDLDARRAWDSVLRQSGGQPYVMFTPPSLQNSTCRFRGLHHDGMWLVQELLHLTGRRVPCELLEYSHPRLLHVVRIEKEPNLPSASSAGAGKSGKNGKSDSLEKTVRKYEIDEKEDGSRSDAKLKSVRGLRKALDFDNHVQVKPQPLEVERARPPASPPSSSTGQGEVRERTKVIKVSAGERAGSAPLPSLEFRLLPAAPMGSLGDLAALEEAIRHLRDEMPHVSIEMSLCHLKAGRAFSTVNREPRKAMVVALRRSGQAPIVLLDVERVGIPALSMMALHFHDAAVSPMAEEAAIKSMLDALVEAGGHWSQAAETALAEVCSCERLPKVLVPREGADARAKVWALRLAERFGLKQD